MIGAEISSYQVHQQIAVTPRKPISTGHPLLIVRRRVVYSYLYVGEISPNMITEENWVVQFRPFPFRATMIDGGSGQLRVKIFRIVCVSFSSSMGGLEFEGIASAARSAITVPVGIKFGRGAWSRNRFGRVRPDMCS